MERRCSRQALAPLYIGFRTASEIDARVGRNLRRSRLPSVRLWPGDPRYLLKARVLRDRAGEFGLDARPGLVVRRTGSDATGHHDLTFTLRGVFVSRAPVRADGSATPRRSRMRASICLRMISRCS